MSTAVAPNYTLYVNNLVERISMPDLKTHLRTVFSPYGNILDVVAGRQLKRRGQAFVVFEEVESATAAMAALQGQDFLGKPLRIAYARSRSDAIAEREGELDAQRQKRSRTREMEREAAAEDRDRFEKRREEHRRKKLLPPNNVLFVEDIPELVKLNVTNTLALKNVFLTFEGCRDVRYIPQKNVAFVEYETIEQAAVALNDTNMFQLFGTPLQVSYARTD